jgi:PAS domain S-box-containing protein
MAQERSLRRVVSRSYRGVALLVILFLTVVGTVFATEYGYFDREVRRTDQATRAFRQFHEGMVDQQTGVRGYLLGVTEDASSFLEPYVAGRAAAAANFDVAAGAVDGDAELVRLLRTAAERAARWQKEWAEPAVRDRTMPTADPATFHTRGKTLFDAYRRVAETLIDALKQRKDGLVARQQTLFGVGLGLSALAGLIVLAGVYRQHRRLVRALVDPVADLASTVHRIRDGHPRQPVAPAAPAQRGRPAELTALAADIDDMARALLRRDAELHRSREMLVQAQHLTGVGSWELDVDTRALTWSDQMYVIKAVEPGSTVTPEMMLEMTHPDDREAMAQAVRLAATQGGVHRFDHRTVRSHGEVRYIGGQVEGELDADGRPFRVTGTSQDVTDRRAAEVALTESEARYRLLAQNSSDVILRHRPDGTLLYVSPASEALLGIAPETAVGHRLFDLVHLDDLPEVRHHQQEMADGGDRTVLTARVRHADGHFVWTESVSTAVRSPEGHLEEVHTAVRDITERMRAQEEIRRQAVLFEHISDAVLITDVAGVVVDCNSAAVQRSGYSREELIGRVPGEHHDPEGARRNAAVVAAHVAEHGSHRADFPLVRRNGQRGVVEAVTVAVRDRDGEMISMIDVSRDVTEERELEAARERTAQAMAEARDAALAATAAKSAFLATMSHEIRTPMNAVIGMTGLLLDTDLDPQQRDFAETVRGSGDALLAVINDILDFSKIEAGELELERAPFAVRDCVESALDLVAGTASAKQLDLMYQLDAACPDHVVGDVTRLRQVLVNLLSNGVKFTQRGDVLLSVDPGAGPDTLRFSVADTGMGIPRDRMDRLFRSFSQLDTSTTRVHGGTGLGLAISDALVQAMGGNLEVTSTVGRGSEFSFTVTLPAAESAGATVVDTVAADLPGRSVLVVDDNPTNRRILRLQFEGWGMSCTDVATPAEGLELIADGHGFDLAVLDMTMPLMDGDELASRLHALPGGETLPLVLLTSVGRPPTGDHFAAYLTKPVKTAALRDIVARTLLPEREIPRSAGTAPAAAPDTVLRVLLAEDNAVNQKVCQLMLARLGHRVDTVGNGREALEAVVQQPYDVVLMDIHMPEMDGLDATRRIRTEVPADRQPHIVAVTASALISDRDACAAAGMDHYLPKPVRMKDLADLLARLGRRGSAPAELPDELITEPGGDAPTIDPAALDGLLQQLGDAGRATRRAVLDSYLDQGAGWIGELVTAAHAGGHDIVARIAHTLRSSSEIVGARRLADLLRAAEEAGRTRTGDLVVGAVAIEDEYHRVAAALGELRADDETRETL